MADKSYIVNGQIYIEKEEVSDKSVLPPNGQLLFVAGTGVATTAGGLVNGGLANAGLVNRGLVG